MTEAHLDVAYSRFLLATDYERRLPGACPVGCSSRLQIVGLVDYVHKVVFRISEDCLDCINILDNPPFQTCSICSPDSMVTLTLLFQDSNHAIKLSGQDLMEEQRISTTRNTRTSGNAIPILLSQVGPMAMKNLQTELNRARDTLSSSGVICSIRGPVTFEIPLRN